MQRVGVLLARGIEGLSIIAARLGALAVLAMMVLITVEVLYRSLFRRSTLMAEELGGFLLLAVTFLPVADLMRRGGHIVVDVVVRQVPDLIAGWLRLLTYLLGFGYVSVFLWQAVAFQNQLLTLDRKSLVLLFPFRFVQPFMIVGLALLWLVLVVLIVRHAHALLWPSTAAERTRALQRAHGPAEPSVERLLAE